MKTQFASVENIRKSVGTLIKQHEPHKIGVVDELMRKWKGKELKLYKELCAQYKVAPDGQVGIHYLKGDYSIGPKIGTGGFAVVRKCKHKKSGESCALKIINKKALSKEDLSILESEVRIMNLCHHPNIVRLHDIFDGKSKLCLIMDLLEGGELFDRIVNEGHFSEKMAAEQFVQILSALSYLHQSNIVHRDLKPENLLYATKSKESQIKLIDFGLAGSVKESLLKTPCGTPNYVAPEILRQQPYGASVDMWSIGVILYIILCGFPPFYDENDDMGKLYKKIKAAQFTFPKPHWTHISKEAKDIIVKLLNPDPQKRFTANQALKHEWCVGKASDKPLGPEQLFHLKRFQYVRKFKRGVRCILAVLKLAAILEGGQKKK